MAPLVDEVGPRPRLGDVEAPPRSRSSLSSVAEVESEPLGRARRRPSARTGQKTCYPLPKPEIPEPKPVIPGTRNLFGNFGF
jgi:hypothetical protein